MKNADPSPLVPTDHELLSVARTAIEVEAKGVAALGARLGEEFLSALRCVLDASGRVIVTGVGKSGLVARKIASTLSSTGTPALFLHPTEGAHGDVGVLVEGDVLLVVSKSGANEELVTLLPAVRSVGARVIAITGSPDSLLAEAADVVLDASVDEEACQYDVAPTASSTVALVLGDAFALALVRARGLNEDDFARLHPGGALGRRLLWTVRDVMLTGEEVPTAAQDATLSTVMYLIAHQRGTVAIVDKERLVGVLTAGDLTRFASKCPDFFDQPAYRAMTKNPQIASLGELAVIVRSRMEKHGVMALPVIEQDRLVGMVHLHDILRAGIHE